MNESFIPLCKFSRALDLIIAMVTGFTLKKGGILKLLCVLNLLEWKILMLLAEQ